MCARFDSSVLSSSVDLINLFPIEKRMKYIIAYLYNNLNLI